MSLGTHIARNSVNFATSGVANTMGTLTSAMCTIERAKIPTMISAARGHMQSNLQSKIGVVCELHRQYHSVERGTG